MDPFSLIVAVVTFVTATMLAVAVGRALSADLRLDDRLQQFYDEQAATSPGRRSRLMKVTGKAAATARPPIRILPNLGEERGRWQARLMHAGIYSPVVQVAYLPVQATLTLGPPAVAAALGVLGWCELRHALCIGAALGGLGMILPGMWLDRLKRRRHALLSRSLADFLDLLVACLESGLSIEAALQRVTDELQLAHPILGGELRVVQTQIDLGATPETALRSFADRADFDALRSLSTVVQQSRRFGTGVAESLRQHADGLRAQREQAAEEKAQKASVQILLPTMLLIFPAIFIVLAGPAAIKLSETFSNNGAAPPRATAGTVGRGTR